MSVWAEGVWASGLWADGVWSEGETPVVQPPVVHVGAVGRGRQRVYVEIRDGRVYEAGDEVEAKAIVKKIKRKAVRRMAQAERAGDPPPPLPKVEISGVAPFMDALRRDVGEINLDLAMVYKRFFEAMDDDEAELLL